MDMEFEKIIRVDAPGNGEVPVDFEVYSYTTAAGKERFMIKAYDTYLIQVKRPLIATKRGLKTEGEITVWILEHCLARYNNMIKTFKLKV